MGQRAIAFKPLIAAEGGSGRKTLTDKAVLVGVGPTDPLKSVAPAGSGDAVLYSDGTNWNSKVAGKMVNASYAACAVPLITTSNTPVDTGLSLTVNRLFPDSKVLVIIRQNGIGKIPTSGRNSFATCIFQVWRDAVQMQQWVEVAAPLSNVADGGGMGTFSWTFLDTPPAGSSPTYKTKLGAFMTADQVIVQWGNCVSSILAFELIKAIP